MSNSHVQQAIISRLKNADVLRYSELRQIDVDRDLFNYHLRELVEKGIITKLANRGGYTLSQKGQQRVADSLHTSDQSNRLFKINPLLIAIDARPGGLYILNQYRTAQPDYGTVGVPGGTIIKSEPLLAGAHRKMLEETGIRADFEYFALTRRVIYTKTGNLFADVVFPICISFTPKGSPKTTAFGSNQWVSIDEAIENEGTRIEYLGTVLTALRDGTLESLRGSYHEQIVHQVV